MLEVHRWRQVDWRPSAVVALATSVNGTVVAAARENGAIELWNVAPGSAGWHCILTIPGKEDAAISSLVWCKSWDEELSPLGRLFSAGLDGFITEWDLETLQPKEIVESYGGSVWQLAVEPLVKSFQIKKSVNGSIGIQNGMHDDSDASSDESDSDSEDARQVGQEAAEQRVAVGCDDGCLRLFTVCDSEKGLVYRRTFPRVKGRVLSVAWSVDGSKIYSGGSDGCIRCWDSHKIQELFRITAGIGGVGGGTELCVWSLLVLRDGTIVSGDSSGSTQFWEGKHGTLLQGLATHRADVLSLAAAPSHRGVYAAGADGQVVLYQHVNQTLNDQDGVGAGSMIGPLTDKWVCVGSKRTHTHDVRALAVAFPCVREEGQTSQEKVEKRARKRNYPGTSADHKKWLQPGTAMLISGGNDSKLFTYPANAFLAFHPHDICPAPQRPHIQLASGVAKSGATMFMAQYSTWVDVWRTHTNSKTLLDMKEGLDFRKEILGKRKGGEEGIHISRKNMKANGGLTANRATDVPVCNGKNERLGNGYERTDMTKTKGISPELVARIKCKSAEHITCSAISGNGKYVAFSDRLKPRLYELEHEKPGSQSSKRMKGIVKKKLPANILAAQSMHFTHDCTRLLLGRHHQIQVLDVENAEVVHTFQVETPVTSGEEARGLSPLKLICTSADSQWVAAITSSGYVHIFNLETLKHHWSIPVPDGSVATSAIFRLSISNVLIISTSTNQIHVLNVEAKELSEWSAVNGAQMARCMLEFPGAIIGLSVPPASTSTSVIAYSSRAMCKIDFSKSLRESTVNAREEETLGTTAATTHSSARHNRHHASENGVEHIPNGDSNVNSNFVVVQFKNPVLFLGHTAPSSVLVVEKPWLDVLRKLPAPVFRHLYGT